MLRKHQIVLITTLAVSPLLTFGSANAQSEGKRPETTGSASSSSPGAAQVPLGRRQPRASDIPADTPKTEEEQRQIQRDHELDKQLWICRGCGAPP